MIIWIRWEFLGLVIFALSCNLIHPVRFDRPVFYGLTLSCIKVLSLTVFVASDADSFGGLLLVEIFNFGHSVIAVMARFPRFPHM